MQNFDLEQRGNFIQKWITELFILNPPSFNKNDYNNIISNFKNKLIFIERKSYPLSTYNYIPCLFYRCPESSNFLIYFHGNSEHIFQIEYYGLDFRTYLKMNVILVEYPGYSIYDYANPDPNLIFLDALTIFDWIKNYFHINNNQIFICGRSLGTSPAIYLSSQRNPNSLIVISPFKSIKDIGKDFHASIFLEKIFKSQEYIKDVKCPILFIHGKKDSLINYEHTLKLKNETKNNNIEIKLKSNMSHNEFDFKNDIINNIQDFLVANNLINNNIKIVNDNEIEQLYKLPQQISLHIESILFKSINDFKFYKNIEKQNANLLLKLIDNNIALTNNNIISIYNYKNYNLEEEIDVEEENNAEINCLIQMKNEDIIFGTNTGNIYIFKKDKDLEEFKELNHYYLNGEIYKIDKFAPNYISILTNKEIVIYDDIEYKQQLTINLIKTYADFIQLSEIEIAMLSKKSLNIFTLENNKLNLIKCFDNLNINNKTNTLTSNNQYLLLGGINNIYYFDYIHNQNTIKQRFISKDSGEIIFIKKINNQLFLASTSNGIILEIILNELYEINIKERIMMKNQSIYSLLLKNYNTLLISTENGFQIWSANQKDWKGKDCEIF